MNVEYSPDLSSKQGTQRMDPIIITLPGDEDYSVAPLFTTEPMASLRSSLMKSEDEDFEEYTNRRRTRSMLAGREKRKRTRVSNEQLLMLERIFAADRNPTATKRREIGELLGMHERQTQIWFQNRRAKARSIEIRQKELMNSSEPPPPPPETPPKLSRGFEIELHNLLHEVDSILIIPSLELCIGQWRRIASSNSKHDLVAYGCEARRSITWFIHSSGHGYKMEIPIEAVLDVQFTSISPDKYRVTLLLSRPPDFYLQNFDEKSSSSPYSSSQFWKRTQDWTENKEASQSLRHILTGPAPQLAHVMRSLFAAGSAEVKLNPAPSGPSTRAQQSPAPLSPLQLSIQPMTGFSSPEVQEQLLSPDSPSFSPGLGRRRLSSTAGSVSSYHSTGSEISLSSLDSDYQSHPTPPDYPAEFIQAGPQVDEHLKTNYNYAAEPEVYYPEEQTQQQSYYAIELPVGPIETFGDASYPSHAADVPRSSYLTSQECLGAPHQTWEPPFQPDGSSPHQQTFPSAGPYEPYVENPAINPTNPLHQQQHQGTPHAPLSVAPYYAYPPSGSLPTKCPDVMPNDRYVGIVADHAPACDFGPEYPVHYTSFSGHP